MATQETQKLDEIISSRRAMMLGGAALAGLALTGVAKAQAAINDNDILNFALNLEYLEANFYTLADSGKTIDQVGIGITGTGTQGTVSVNGTAASNKVAFANANIAAYVTETATEERKHVAFLRNALGNLAVAQPAINLGTVFTDSMNGLGAKVGVPGYSPYANDVYFLLGAYIFEDVGVTAYHGAAGSITSASVLAPAVGIHAVEAYHAGLVRTALYGIDQGTITVPGVSLPTGTVAGLTRSISALRQTLDGSANPPIDDYGLMTSQVALNGASANFTSSQVVNADPTNSQGFARTPAQVLKIVYAGGTTSGGFFPSGLNGTIK